MSIELRHLRYFIAVAEEGHVTRASERLGIQQPPLSLQIRALERQVGVQLFRRLPRGMELTDAGRVLFDDARAIVERLERSLEHTRRTARGDEGALCIGVAPTAPFNPFVPRTIRAFREAYPAVSLTLEEGLSNEVATRLAEGGMDLAFVRVERMTLEALVVTPLVEERLLAALPKGHRLASSRRRESLALRELKSDPFILYGPPGTGLHDETVKACIGAGFAPVVGQRAPRITSTLGLVAAGMGVALVPESMSNVRVDGVAYRPLAANVRARSVLGIASRRHDPSPAVTRFIEFARRTARHGGGTR